MDNKQLLINFYAAFAAGDAEGMVACYSDDIEFTDPAFGLQIGENAKNMWRMLLKNPDIKVTVSNIEANEKTGSANWVAVYTFSRTGRKVTNRVSAKFEFGGGKITKHTDYFNIWKWAGQAMGIKGYLLGWTPLMQNGIHKQAVMMLTRFNI
ncbi:ketosteroid isomerase-like protein [Mucilaginibacter gracilis]|uniref:Ketosteroid isomerase-like protein n=1 Tax=Mucilaginibacter gracilis TaxID=423350 RepID=A0A495J512_9SPHI|nr:nuclear transport factor 2 family protein [Mucilaginibacter gracilis]RKR83801.1 ketosteroid isomerase-like protein [Mucilaginibacter gracilis]